MSVHYFSNSGEADHWQSTRCNAGCWHDRNQDCERILAMLTGEPHTDLVRDGGKLECRAFTTEAQRVEIPGQTDIFGEVAS